MLIINVLVIGNQILDTVKDIFTTIFDIPAFFYAKDIDHVFYILSNKDIDILLHSSIDFQVNEWNKLKQTELPLIFLDTISVIEVTTSEMDILFDGFLGKPISSHSLKAFLRELIKNQLPASSLPSKQAFFFIRSENIYKKIEIADLIWIEIDGNYSMLNFSDKKYTLKISLTKLHQNLPSSFIRIHKRFVINTQYIKTINPIKNEVYLAKYTFPIGRTYKVKVYEYLKLLH